MEDDDSWVDASVEEAGPCPRCGALEAKPILYGMPDFGSYDRLQGRVEFAGCLIPMHPYDWRCGRCGAQWGLSRLGGGDEDPLR